MQVTMANDNLIESDQRPPWYSGLSQIMQVLQCSLPWCLSPVCHGIMGPWPVYIETLHNPVTLTVYCPRS